MGIYQNTKSQNNFKKYKSLFHHASFMAFKIWQWIKAVVRSFQTENLCVLCEGSVSSVVIKNQQI
jgi:hypothetical protein